MEMKEFDDLMDISDEVSYALKANIPIVALESTIVAQSGPYPKNVKRALMAESIVRQHGCVPATIAIIKGRIKVGLSEAEIDYIATKKAKKISHRDVAPTIALKQDGATTVATTMMIAGLVGIKVFATGGIGGVHRGFEQVMDVSADLEELATRNMVVVCSGPKAILDQKRTVEYCETKGISILGWKTDDLPGFYTRTTGLKVDYRVDHEQDVVSMLQVNHTLNNNRAILVCNPVSEAYAMDQVVVDQAILQALEEAKRENISGKEVTPFLLGAIKEFTQGANKITNEQLVYENVHVASLIAAAMK